MFEIAKAMFADAWNQRLEQATQAAETLQRKLGEIETKIGDLLERILDVSNPRVISAYENKIAELERQKLLTQDQVEQSKTTNTHSRSRSNSPVDSWLILMSFGKIMT
ncbi:MAG: hypothetical protein AAGB10_21640 [Pseudomonadota bacterium]